MNPAEWIDTPGWYYALAYFLAGNVYILSNKRKTGVLRSILTEILFAVLLVGVTLLGKERDVAFISGVILYTCSIWLTIYLNTVCNLPTALYFAVRAFIAAEFAASLEWQIFYYAVRYWQFPVNMWVNVLFLIVIHGAVFSILFVLERKNRKMNSELQVNARELSSTIIIGVAVFAVSNISYVLRNTPFSSQFATEIFIIRTLVDLGGVAVLYAYHVQLSSLNARLEVEKLQDMLNMQYNNYAMMEQSIAVVNQKYHDLKYQIAVLKQDVNAKESMAYLDKMEQDIKAYEAQNKTGNPILDTILTAKSLYCQSNWIELTCVADGAAISFMDNMDISTLFGNALDNAIESVSKIQNKEKRLIHVSVSRQKNFVRIRIENCYLEEPVFENGLPATTKTDKKYHGFGLKSIKNTAKKYGGSTTIQAKDGWFELRILIPIPESCSE